MWEASGRQWGAAIEPETTSKDSKRWVEGSKRAKGSKLGGVDGEEGLSDGEERRREIEGREGQIIEEKWRSVEGGG